MIFWQIHKLAGVIDRSSRFRWWPHVDGHIQREVFWQDHSNYHWYLCVGWLWWWMEMEWQKVKIGWFEKGEGK